MMKCFRPCPLVVYCLTSEQRQKRVVFLCTSPGCNNSINNSYSNSNSKQRQPTIKYSKCNNNQVLYRPHVSYFYFWIGMVALCKSFTAVQFKKNLWHVFQFTDHELQIFIDFSTKWKILWKNQIFKRPYPSLISKLN